MTLTIHVDWDLCEANGVCMDECPEVFELDEKDELHVHADQVTEEREAAIRRAVRRCPRQALSIEES